MVTHRYPRLFLQAVNHPELGSIEIDGCLFPIGRLEVPFSSHKSEAVTKLSRRHARIFREHNSFYLADLGSLNGTTVNDSAVKQHPVCLKDGDEVCFAEIQYRVAVTQQEQLETTEVIETDPAQVTLIPATQHDGDPIVINSFPFLISKSSGVFSQYKERFDLLLPYISRRHAHIYLQNNRVFVEDLGSTNGTFVCGERLDEHARELLDGDTVAFGAVKCAFQVHVIIRAEPDNGRNLGETSDAELGAVTNGAESDTGGVEHGTILVDKASPFLDIFYDRDMEEASDSCEPETPPIQEHSKPGAKRQAHRKLTKFWLFWSELRGALSEDQKSKYSSKWIWACALLLALGGSVAFYQQGSAERELRELLRDADYKAAVLLSDKLLREAPESERIRELSTQALLNHAIPEWREAIEQRDFNTALEISRNTLMFAQANEEAYGLFEVVNWISELERYFVGLNTEQPLVIYQNEEGLKVLTEQWRSNTSEYQRRLGVIQRVVPEFKESQVQALSHLRLLQNYASIYLNATEELKQDITHHLSLLQLDALRDRLLSFQNKYPKVGGIRPLLEDLDIYVSLKRDLDQKRLLSLLYKRNSQQLRTPPFQEAVARNVLSLLPPEEIAERYLKSAADWKAGKAESSIQILRPLIQSPWGEVAQARIERNQTVYEQYQAFMQGSEAERRSSDLVAFYNGLDPEIDKYYLKALQEAFMGAKADVQTRADEDFGNAEKSWQGYRTAGGITGLLRLEETVSRRFRQRALLLTTAQSYASQGVASYVLLRLDLPPGWVKLKSDIQNELKRQRSWLLDLQKVLPSELVKDKLKLLNVEGSNAVL